MTSKHPAARSLCSFLGPIALGDFGDTLGSTSLPDKIAKRDAGPVEQAILDFFNKYAGSEQVRNMDQASERATAILGRIVEAEIEIIDKAKAIKREITLHEVAKSTLFENKDKLAEAQFRAENDAIDRDIEKLEKEKQPFLDQLAEIDRMTDLSGAALSYYRRRGYAGLVNNPNLAELTDSPLLKDKYRSALTARPVARP